MIDRCNRNAALGAAAILALSNFSPALRGQTSSPPKPGPDLDSLVLKSRERSERVNSNLEQGEIANKAGAENLAAARAPLAEAQAQTLLNQAQLQGEHFRYDGEKFEDQLVTLGLTLERAKFERGKLVLETVIERVKFASFSPDSRAHFEERRADALAALKKIEFTSAGADKVANVPSEGLLLAMFDPTSVLEDVKSADALICYMGLTVDLVKAGVLQSARLNLATSGLMAPGTPPGHAKSFYEQVLEDANRRGREAVLELDKKSKECRKKTADAIEEFRRMTESNSNDASKDARPSRSGFREAGDSFSRSSGGGRSSGGSGDRGGGGGSTGKAGRESRALDCNDLTTICAWY